MPSNLPSDAKQNANQMTPESMIGQRLRPDQLAEAARGRGAWLWHGYVGAGKMTLLTSQWKAGKTTLLANLLARLGQGGTLAGLPVAAGRAAVISEEGPDNWDKRCRKLDIGPHLSLFCRPFRGRPTPDDWRNLLATLLDMRRHEGLDLVAIDPLSVFLPTANENSASIMMECLLPLQDLTAAGLAVLLTHHPRKGATTAGQAARGSGALPSHVDILMEMNWYGAAHADDRRRWLRAFSRHEETRGIMLVELAADGKDYLTHAAADNEASAECGQVLYLVLEDASGRLTQREVLEDWPPDFPKPDLTTIARALKRGVADGRIRQGGTGRKNEPFRYWLPHREEDLYPGEGASKEEIARWNVNWQDRFMRKLLANEKALGFVDEPAVPVGAEAEPKEELGEQPATSAPILPHTKKEEPTPQAEAVQSEPAAAPVPATPPEPAAPPENKPPTELIPYLKWREEQNKVDWRKYRRLA